MKLLFVGPGYPGARSAGAGSGIGTYLRELCLGLAGLGHECHVLVWSTKTPRRTFLAGPSPDASESLEGITIHVLDHFYWPVFERVFPDACDVQRLTRVVESLDQKHGFDWIEIENEEGLGVGIQDTHSSKVLLRIHTTLAQMVEHLQVKRTWRVDWRMRREAVSLRKAKRRIVSSLLHAVMIQSRFGLLCRPEIVPLGLDYPKCRKPMLHDEMRCLVVGAPDARKGGDRIRPVLEAYIRQYGPCTVTIVAEPRDDLLAVTGLAPSRVGPLQIRWTGRLSDEELKAEYSMTSAVLHLARYESFGYPLIEAAAAGVPLVVTDVGIARELLAGELGGFIVDGDDFEACARALFKAMSQRDEWGDRLRAEYELRYTRASMVRNYLGFWSVSGGR